LGGKKGIRPVKNWGDGGGGHWVKKEKEKKSIYIAPFCTKVHTKRSGIDHTVLPANNTMTPFLRGVHQMSPLQQLRQQTSNCSSLLFIDPEMMKG